MTLQVIPTLCKCPTSPPTHSPFMHAHTHSFIQVVMSQALGWALGMDTVVGGQMQACPQEIRVQAEQTHDLTRPLWRHNSDTAPSGCLVSVLNSTYPKPPPAQLGTTLSFQLLEPNTLGHLEALSLSHTQTIGMSHYSSHVPLLLTPFPWFPPHSK